MLLMSQAVVVSIVCYLREDPTIAHEDFGIFRKRPECFRFREVAHEYFCLLWFVCFVLIVDRHHIDYRTLGSQAAANLLGEVNNKSICYSEELYDYAFILMNKKAEVNKSV